MERNEKKFFDYHLILCGGNEMKIAKWFLPVLCALLMAGLFFAFPSCVGDDDDDDKAPEKEEEEQLPECEYEYPNAPAGEGTVQLNGLEWTTYDSGSDIDHNCALHYVADLEYDGKDDWRLPTINELAVLYDPEEPQGVDCKPQQAYIVSPFQISCFLMWTSLESSLADYYQAYSFIGPNTEGSAQDVEFDHTANIRVLAVRDL